MDLLETIISKAVAGDLSAISEKEILMASLFELKSVKKELVSLNDKIDVLEIKIDETALASTATAKLLEAKYDKKFSEIENKMAIYDEVNMEGKFWKKFLGYIPPFLGAIAVIIGIIEAWNRFHGK